jgi:hypothetical protein
MPDKEKKKETVWDTETGSPGDNPGFPGLRAIPSVSLLGDHNGILDDDVFEMLNSEVSAKDEKHSPLSLGDRT